MSSFASVDIWNKTLWSLTLSFCFDKLCNSLIKLFQIRTLYLEKDLNAGSALNI